VPEETPTKPTKERPPPQVWERPPTAVRTEECRSCHAAIWWHTHPTSGRAFPVTVETGHNHFIDSVDRRLWRVKR
jgi:hypothetical protein